MGQEQRYAKATAILAKRRAAAESAAEQRRSELAKELPQLRRFDGEAAALCRRLTAAVMENDTEAAAEAKASLEQLTRDRDAFLQSAGIDEALLKPRYACPLCRDTGFVGGKRCRCLEELLRTEAARELPTGVLSACPHGFEGFDLSYYSDQSMGGRSPRETMANILARCRDYAAGFSGRSGNLLFIGRTGLGKTYLSVCIAREVLEKGFSVQYAPAQTLIDRFERVRFSRGTTPEDLEITRDLLRCDLLILDDLGAEFINQFSQSVLYNVINERLVEGRPTIISTNLDPAQLSQTYAERIVSRLIGSYTLYGFAGRDIRQQKQLRQIKEQEE